MAVCTSHIILSQQFQEFGSWLAEPRYFWAPRNLNKQPTNQSNILSIAFFSSSIRNQRLCAILSNAIKRILKLTGITLANFFFSSGNQKKKRNFSSCLLAFYSFVDWTNRQCFYLSILNACLFVYLCTYVLSFGSVLFSTCWRESKFGSIKFILKEFISEISVSQKWVTKM